MAILQANYSQKKLMTKKISHDHTYKLSLNQQKKAKLPYYS